MIKQIGAAIFAEPNPLKTIPQNFGDSRLISVISLAHHCAAAEAPPRRCLQLSARERGRFAIVRESTGGTFQAQQQIPRGNGEVNGVLRRLYGGT